MPGAMRTNDTRSITSILLADLALKSGDLPLAEHRCKQILSADPQHLPAMELLAKTLWRMERHGDLLSTVRAMIGLNPYEPAYHTLLGTTLLCLGRYAEAGSAFQRSGDDPQCDDMRDAIECWQATTTRELLRTDLVFRAEFSRDPADACRRRGLTFAGHVDEAQWPMFDRQSLRASIRMS